MTGNLPLTGTAFIAGAALTWLIFMAGAKHTAALIGSNRLTAAKKPFLNSLLNPFAVLFQAHKRKVSHFLETIEEMGGEISVLIEKHQLLTENLAAAVVIRDASGKIRYCSPYTEVLTGYATNEIYASEQDFFLSIVHEEDRETYRRALKVSEFGEAFQFRFRFIHKTGILMWGETRTVPILDPQGEVNSSLSVTIDVTGTVLYQKQVEEKNRDLQDFTYMVSHDLKAPIFTIKGMLGIIEEDAKNGMQAIDEPLQHIRNAASRLEQLVGSVLEYSRISSQETLNEDVDLGQVLGEVLKDYGHQIKEIGAQVNLDSSLPVAVGDRLRTYQIFSNIVGNAIKYREPSRPLVLDIFPAGTAGRRLAAVTVRDNGSGIPADKLESIFRPFQRAHAGDTEGSGIGLACVKKLLEKLGGQVEVKSEPGKGSEFTVSLRKKAPI